MKKTNKLYLAYGSNLNLEQMAFRCPYAVPLGPVWLEGYRLLFRGSKSGAYATLEPYSVSRVPALLWEITPRDEEALDRYEGWPRFYRKEMVPVEHNGKMLDVMVYIMNEGCSLGMPSKNYLDIVRAGYDSAGFDHAVLDEAMRASAPDKLKGQIMNEFQRQAHMLMLLSGRTKEASEFLGKFEESGNVTDTAKKCGDCLACSNSMSEPVENAGEADKLFCVVKQEYVSENGCCDEFN